VIENQARDHKSVTG